MSVKMSKTLYSICIMSITSFNCIHNIQNSADKSRKTYVLQLRTQSSIGCKKKKKVVMKNVINYVSMWYITQNVAFYITALANRSLQLKIRPRSDDISCNHKQPHLTRACYTCNTYGI